MQILSCSLSCGGSSGGSQISCGLNQVALNETLVLDFNQPVDLASVDKNTFQVTDLSTGTSPTGVFTLDPGNPNRLMFRPQLIFDAAGTPIFGFEEQHSYQVLVRGVNQDSGGAFVKSLSGEKNLARLFCTISASGISDLVPGSPSVTATLDVVTQKDPDTGEVLAVEALVASGGVVLTEVWNASLLRLSFNDVMNPATLVNPATGLSSTIRVFVDADGDTLSQADRIELAGLFTIHVNDNTLVTEVTFAPSGGWPSAGTGALPRAVVVELPDSIVDLGAHALINHGELVFVPEFVPFDEVLIPAGGEQFVSDEHLDADNTGALWGGGALMRGMSGGSGRLGPLVVGQGGAALVLNTDEETFSSVHMIAEGPVVFPPSSEVPSATVSGGVFEFSSLDIGAGAQLRFEGSQPARLIIRGAAYVRSSGSMDLSGRAAAGQLALPVGHDSSAVVGGLGGSGGPSGGAGGQGGDRPDDTDAELLAVGGISNPGAVTSGRPGGGVGGVGDLAAGQGGLPWPLMAPVGVADLSAFVFNRFCRIGMTPGPGSGGGYATSGTDGVPTIMKPLNYPLNPPGLVAPVTAGGDSAELGLTSAMRTLDPALGFLRGGAGGGGGGQGYQRSRRDGIKGADECLGGTEFSIYWTHSGAGGGGGGGALQLHAGKSLTLEGSIVARGGLGGAGQGGTAFSEVNELAMPGGGGAGGAVLLQAPVITVAETGQRIRVNGGAGGIGPGSPQWTSAGSGGLGLVRMEANSALDALEMGPRISPYDPALGSESGGDTSSVILSVGTFAVSAGGVADRSGGESCWMSPAGNYFLLDFAGDDLSDPENTSLGWDLDVVSTLPDVPPFSLRDASDPNNPFGVAPEDLFGSDLGGVSPGALIVRFQGVHRTRLITSLCDVDLTDPIGDVDPASVTPWVRHPAELNTYWDAALPSQPELAAKRRSNMIRYQVIFDHTAPQAGLIAGVTNLRIHAQPD